MWDIIFTTDPSPSLYLSPMGSEKSYLVLIERKKPIKDTTTEKKKEKKKRKKKKKTSPKNQKPLLSFHSASTPNNHPSIPANTAPKSFPSPHNANRHGEVAP